jgi:hypothetical protein
MRAQASGERLAKMLIRAPHALVILALSSGLAGCAPAPSGFAQSGKASKPAARKEGGAMPGIELEAGPERAEVLAGEPIYVNISVTNMGKSPVQVHAAESAPPWEFELAGPDGQRAYAISAQRYANRLADPGRPQPPMMRTLGPMSMAEYRIDLLRWTTEPIAPGKYSLTTSYPLEGETIRSQPAPLAVVAPNVAAYVTVSHASADSAGGAFLHRAADGSSVLYQREGDPREPASGVAYPRSAAPRGRTISSFALGCPIDRWRGARWIGWIEGDSMRAVLSSGDTVWAQFDPIPTGLASPALTSPAYQLFDGHAVFFVYGLKAGRAFLTRITLKFQEPPAVASVALQSLPRGRVLAQYVGTAAGGTVILVWEEPAGGGQTLKAAACQFGEGGLRSAERTILSGDRPALAFDAAPLVSAPGDVDVLLGAAGPAASMTYRRVPLTSGRPSSEWPVSGPVLEPGERAAAWAVLAGDMERAPAALVTARRLLSIDARSGAGWKSAPVPAEGRFLTLFRAPEAGLWATWADGPIGIHFTKIGE